MVVVMVRRGRGVSVVRGREMEGECGESRVVGEVR